MQCGPVRFTADAKQQIASQSFARRLFPRFTSFRLLDSGHDDNFTFLCDKLMDDDRRNDLIVSDVLAAVSQHKCPLVLTSRTKHLQALCGMLRAKSPNLTVIPLVGSEKTREKRDKMEALAKHSASEPLVIVAIDKYVGEGFDYPRLDTLFLTLPFSYKARVAQYAGRLHREFPGKTEVRIYDYVDIHVPLAEKMYRRRMRGYSAVGYNRLAENMLSGEDCPRCIYSGEEYWGSFMNDVKAFVCKSLIIAMPRIWLPEHAPMLDVLSEKVTQGVEVVVLTRTGEALSRLAEMGMCVRLKEYSSGCSSDDGGDTGDDGGNGIVVPCAILDGKLVWYGEVNYLANVRTEEYSIRMEDSKLAEELMNMML